VWRYGPRRGFELLVYWADGIYGYNDYIWGDFGLREWQVPREGRYDLDTRMQKSKWHEIGDPQAVDALTAKPRTRPSATRQFDMGNSDLDTLIIVATRVPQHHHSTATWELCARNADAARRFLDQHETKTGPVSCVVQFLVDGIA
jgi:hypothetical protein